MPLEVRDPILRHAWTHKSVGYWASVRLRDGKFIYRREEGMFDRVTCPQFLYQFYRESTRGPRRVVVISDNVGYHHARLHKDWRAGVASRFELSLLPAVSHGLNPIECVWELTRRRCPHNRYFPKLEDVSHAVEGTPEGPQKGNETLRRLCAIS